MNSKIILCLALVTFHLSAHARGVRLWSDAELMKASDLVVVGQPIKVKDLDESNSLGWDKSIGWSQLTFRGVETTFKVSDVLKGMPATDQIVLHHYRFEKVHPPNGPNLIDFIPGDTNKYLLYLINDGTNRYAPANGQIDPVVRPPPTNSFGFPLLPSIADADPSIRLPLLVHVPTKLTIERTTDTLSVEVNNQTSLEATNLMVGTNMVTGVESRCSVYPVREPSWPGGINPLRQSLGLGGGTDFNLGKTIWHTKPDGIPLPDKKYIIELELTVFETDVPAQHMWNPQRTKNYKVILQRTLRQAVE